MTKPTKAAIPAPPKTIAWFEQAITDATPTTGILASVDQGIWSIAETSGQLAGIWRRHRNQMQDLDEGAVTQALGELLAAIVQTAHAIGVPLETIMTEQAERMRGSAHHGTARTTLPPRTAKNPLTPASAEQKRPPVRTRTVVEQPVSIAPVPSIPPTKSQQPQGNVAQAVSGKHAPRTDTASPSMAKTKPSQRRQVSTVAPQPPTPQHTTASAATAGTVAATPPRSVRRPATVLVTEVPVVVAKQPRTKQNANVRTLPAPLEPVSPSVRRR